MFPSAYVPDMITAISVTLSWRKALLPSWFIVQFIQHELILEMLSQRPLQFLRWALALWSLCLGAISNIWLVFLKRLCCYLSCLQTGFTDYLAVDTILILKKISCTDRQDSCQIQDDWIILLCSQVRQENRLLCNAWDYHSKTPGAWGKPTPQTPLCPSLLYWERALKVHVSETKPLYMWIPSKRCSGSYTGRWTESKFWLRYCNVLLLLCFEMHLFISPQSTRPFWQLELCLP